MTIDQLLLIAVILMLGIAVQAAVGFGAGLFAVPLLVWLGIPLPTSVGMLLSLVIVQTGTACWRHRDQLPWRAVLPMFISRGVGLPVGVLLMYLLTEMDPNRTKQVVGVVVLVALALQIGFRVKPKEQIHGGWTLLAGSLSGLMAGMIGMGGAPLVLWLMAHDWPATRQRVFLWLTFLLLVPVQACLLVLTFGQPLILALLLGLAMTPAGLAGAWLGGHIGRRLSRARLRVAMTWLLVAIALQSIVGPWLSSKTKNAQVAPSVDSRSMDRAAEFEP